MEEWKKRLVEESLQLEEKTNKLDDFLVKDESNNIDSSQRSLLKIQLQAMKTYQQCIQERMRLLGIDQFLNKD